ncbi:MAG: Peptidase M23 [Candidatus Moranbacteria bacterium GW2011_GWE1_49_15]|nr:MAG: Peptidase M23 [Candidatus Moranbacteria bacterium GW2011_GWE2_47_10]KKW06871.1 MAG: Peptidase M23 [Candidatus Moranbacteria bacterium GW2011_GWE1_49_15]
MLTLAMFVVASFSFYNSPAFAEDSADDVKDSIDSIEKKLEKEQAAKAKLEAELAQIQNSVYSTQAQIDKTRALIKESEANISRMEEDVKQLGEKIDFQKEILKNLIQEVYMRKTEPILSMAIFKGDFSKVFGRVDSLLSMEEKILQIAQEVRETKEKVEAEQEKIAQAKEDHEKLLENKVVQQYALLADRAETQDDIEDKEAVIVKLREKLADLQSDLATLTGKSFDAKDIREAVEFASDHTDVPEGVLYGFLGAETHFNANTGQCTYDEVEDAAMKNYSKLLKISKNWQASIDKLEERRDIFEDIVDDLGYSKKKKVSCTPRCDLKISGKTWSCTNGGYIGQGGAMGVAQFMSDVWRYGYEADIRKITGHKTPDPWSLTDGVLAMALKLEKAGANSSKESVIKKASINYLGTFNQSYYNNIIYWSKNYKLIFD